MFALQNLINMTQEQNKPLTFGKKVIQPYRGEQDPAKMTPFEICEKLCKEDAVNIVDMIYGIAEDQEPYSIRRRLLVDVIERVSQAMRELEGALSFNED